jgi:hypothetical protein
VSYRGDLDAAKSRLDQLERELAEDVDPYQLHQARSRVEMLSRQHATLTARQTRLSYLSLARLAVGLLILAASSFDLVASYGTADGIPPHGFAAGWLAALGALFNLVVIGLARPHRWVSIAGLAAVGLVLLGKGLDDTLTTRFDQPSLLFPFVLPGVLAIFFAVILIPLSRQRG